MSYKIAVASSDEIQIDESFGFANRFHIFKIESGICQKVEERIVEEKKSEFKCGGLEGHNKEECHSRADGGCSGNEKITQKVELLEDCRCIVCNKIGFHILKQLERKAITAFDVNCTVEQAIEKITFYYDKIDKGQSLRGAGNGRI